MKEVTDYKEVLEALREVKQHAKGFCANFFPMPDRVGGWIAGRRLRMVGYPGVRVFLRAAASFDYLYFFAEEPLQLSIALPGLVSIAPRTLVAELVGKKTGLDDLQSRFNEAGFQHHKTLQRMVRQSRPDDAAIPAQPVETALDGDVKELLELLQRIFDPYADSIPNELELREALSKGCISIVRRDDNIAALMFLEIAGQSATVRYWAVDSRYRNLGLGAVVMRHALRLTAPRRINLWVISANKDAISKYQHYGFIEDGMEDRIMLMQKEAK